MSLRQRVVRWIPPRIAGGLEYYLRPHLAEEGGPFNGQCFRQQLFSDLLRACRFETLIETGSFRGSTTLVMAQSTALPLYSCEVNPRLFSYCAQRMRKFPKVKLFNQDSRAFLKGLELPRDLRLFFYLDAHWQNDLPLREETEFIVSSFNNYVVMIDDFEVPGDAGYRFDDYGPGKKLSLHDFPFQQDTRLSVYFPNRPSQGESGARRGCVVLASPSLSDSVDHLQSLRKNSPS